MSAIFTPFTSTSTWVDEDLLVLFELSVHGVPVEVDQVAQLLEDKGLRNYGTDAARIEQAGQGSKEMDKENNQIAHRRIVAGRGILRR